MNNPAIVSAWRPTAINVVTLKQESTPSMRELAWRFLKQHGVDDRDCRPCDTNPPEDAA